MSTMRKFLALITIVLATLLGAIAVPTSASAKTVNLAVIDAGSYAASLHVHAAVSVLDTQTGALYYSGYSRTRFPSASVVKVYMAVYLLRRGLMYGYNEQRAWPMITQSNNSAFEYLLGKYFNGSATRLFYWMQEHYPYSRMGAPPTTSWCWGSTRITARGITRLYQKIL